MVGGAAARISPCGFDDTDLLVAAFVRRRVGGRLVPVGTRMRDFSATTSVTGCSVCKQPKAAGFEGAIVSASAGPAEELGGVVGLATTAGVLLALRGVVAGTGLTVLLVGAGLLFVGAGFDGADIAGAADLAGAGFVGAGFLVGLGFGAGFLTAADLGVIAGAPLLDTADAAEGKSSVGCGGVALGGWSGLPPSLESAALGFDASSSANTASTSIESALSSGATDRGCGDKGSFAMATENRSPPLCFNSFSCSCSSAKMASTSVKGASLTGSCTSAG